MGHKICRKVSVFRCHNIIDDECHFFLPCQINDNLRAQLLNYFDKVDHNFKNFSHIDQLKRLLSPSIPCI